MISFKESTRSSKQEEDLKDIVEVFIYIFISIKVISIKKQYFNTIFSYLLDRKDYLFHKTHVSIAH